MAEERFLSRHSSSKIQISMAKVSFFVGKRYKQRCCCVVKQISHVVDWENINYDGRSLRGCGGH
jgi:hypothetical protein